MHKDQILALIESVCKDQNGEFKEHVERIIRSWKGEGSVEYAKELQNLLALKTGDFVFAQKRAPTKPLKDFVYCPPATFTMGRPETELDIAVGEWPEKQVTIGYGFWMGETTVTRQQYAELTGEIVPAKTPDHPMTNIYWHKAAKYCNALSVAHGLDPFYQRSADKDIFVVSLRYDKKSYHLAPGYRLPSAEEWEYACRAGKQAILYGPLDDIAWHSGNSSDVHPVKQKKPNEFGLYDMIGNVWEFLDEVGIVRGGCYKTLPQHSHGCRLGVMNEGSKLPFVGFRVVRTVM